MEAFVIESVVVTGAVVVGLGWRYYVALKKNARLRQQLTGMTNQRDEWRDVAQRALRVAQMGRVTTRRASRALTEVRK